ncbi:hypothetical protein BEWA_002030 [Theileria equi strain WA]|uniref:Uncharacterized protein n=1 Tax=Theileria equi strain WA TaxID=1537102 RepID=L0B0K6_THEEQ|nr:hypothetical protein BEWA_002030 [Theileria equi strain WA]AFZ80796.1 hypothetical protein BEWA_002030 [Theileria equi strain WA]|eukprot:XP_004830462.1 hypothetical protein BEWA_002030 [Theileria equi strain WA]
MSSVPNRGDPCSGFPGQNCENSLVAGGQAAQEAKLEDKTEESAPKEDTSSDKSSILIKAASGSSTLGTVGGVVGDQRESLE